MGATHSLKPGAAIRALGSRRSTDKWPSKLLDERHRLKVGFAIPAAWIAAPNGDPSSASLLLPSCLRRFPDIGSEDRFTRSRGADVRYHRRSRPALLSTKSIRGPFLIATLQLTSPTLRLHQPPPKGVADQVRRGVNIELAH
jgi:hypothetical protein